MDIFILIFILLLFGALLYISYLNALMRFRVSFRHQNRAFNRRFRQQNHSFRQLREKFDTLEITHPKSETGNKQNSGGAANNFDRMEDRYVKEVKDHEIVMVDGKPVRKTSVIEPKN